MLSRLFCGLCPSQDEEVKTKKTSKAPTPIQLTPDKQKVEMSSTSHSSQRNLSTNLDTFEGFVEYLHGKDSLDLFKSTVNIDIQDLSAKEFNRKLWERLLFLEKMVSRQMMLQQISEIPNMVIKSWLNSEQRIISV